jgi:hypothetical protein
VAGVQISDRQGYVSHYAREQIVEVVGDPTGQQTKGFQILGAQKFLFGLPFFGYVSLEPPESKETLFTYIADQRVLEVLG